MKLTLIRHTSLQVNAGICYGQSDIEVAASFHSELAAIKTRLGDSTFDKVYTSPLQRCAKLAEALGIGESLVDFRLMELHFGDWEMMAWDDIPRETFDAWAGDYANLAPPNGETFSQLQRRGISFLEDALLSHPQGHIAAITHGGLIRALIAHVLNMPLKGLFRFTIDHGGISQLELGDPMSQSTVPKLHFVNR